MTVATQSIVQTTTTATTQALAVKAAGDVNLTGANHEANAGLLLCAEGANQEVDRAGSGAGQVAACQGKFANADALVSMNGKLGAPATLKRDEDLLNNAAALAALEKFEQNFGVNKDEYVNRMLASHGKSTEFADMMSAKLSDAQLEKLFTAAGEEAPPVSDSELAERPSGVTTVKTAKKETSLRDSLNAKLAEADAKRKLASTAAPKTDYSSIKVPGEKLQPHGLEPWINGAEDQQEALLTIFDVVHQKLQDLRQRERI